MPGFVFSVLSRPVICLTVNLRQKKLLGAVQGMGKSKKLQKALLKEVLAAIPPFKEQPAFRPAGKTFAYYKRKHGYIDRSNISKPYQGGAPGAGKRA